jgi:hypothetical protein
LRSQIKRNSFSNTIDEETEDTERNREQREEQEYEKIDEERSRAGVELEDGTMGRLDGGSACLLLGNREDLIDTSDSVVELAEFCCLLSLCFQT